MRRYFQITLILFFSALVATQFTNCDVYSESSGLFNQFSMSCVGNECSGTGAKAEFLKIRVNYPNPFYVLSTISYLNVAGECNEGGFPDSVITWNLFEGQTIKSSSDENPAEYQGRCVNGRFQLKVRVVHNYGTDAAPDNYYGLQVPPRANNIFKDHLLEVELYGIDETGTPIKNPSLSPEAIWLVPISFQP